MIYSIGKRAEAFIFPRDEWQYKQNGSSKLGKLTNNRRQMINAVEWKIEFSCRLGFNPFSLKFLLRSPAHI